MNNNDYEIFPVSALTMNRHKRVLKSANSSRYGKSQELSVRQAQIVLLVSQGHRNKAIAKKLGLSVNTVCTHLKQVFTKLQVDSRTGAAIRYLSSLMNTTDA